MSLNFWNNFCEFDLRPKKPNRSLHYPKIDIYFGNFVYFIFLFFCFNLDSQGVPNTAPKVNHGVLQIEGWDFDIHKEIDLSGEWKLESINGSVPILTSYYLVPGLFQENSTKEQFPNNLGSILLSLDIHLPEETESLSILVPGNQSNRLKCASSAGGIVQSGRISFQNSSLHPVLSPYILNLPRGKSFHCEWFVEVSQKEFSDGMNGIWSSPKLGATGSIHAKFDMDRMYFSGMVAFLISMGLYFFVQWILRRDDFRPLAVCCSNISIGILMYYFGDLPVNSNDTKSVLHTRIEYSMIPLIGVSIQFVIYTFSKLKVHRWVWIWIGLQIASSLIQWIIPVSYLQMTLLIGEVSAGISIVFVFYLLIKWYWIATSVWHEKLLIWSLTSPGIFGGLDLIANRFFQKNLGLTPFGMIVFSSALALSIARRTAKARRQAEEYALALSETNYSLQKFVPTEFLKELGLNSVTEAELGKAKSKIMTVLFSDLRGFTTISENLSPEETFRFLNLYLSRLGPKIREYGGFIDKYIGDAIMALYTGSSADALDSALAMIHEIKKIVNSKENIPVSLGIGIHKGPVIMGTIGEEKRFEATVISDTVNLTSRIESFTKALGVDILVTSVSYLELREDQKKFTRWVGSFMVKGKQQDIHLYEVFTLDEEELREKKLKFKNAIHETIHKLIKTKNIDIAIDSLNQILLESKNDSVVQWWVSHLETSIEKRRSPLNENGSVVLKDK
jgi:adenylate cyclase